MDLLHEYDIYIQDANENERYRDGWYVFYDLSVSEAVINGKLQSANGYYPVVIHKDFTLTMHGDAWSEFPSLSI